MEGPIFLLIYFTPSLWAVLDGHADAGAILVVNALLGWTLIGWVVAFAWALKRS
ncbi:superinfection immunity protein [Halorhodospira sp. 9622]|uniref:superinfection immunity protein n=1 Tax=Halorhodospira sp. 9622 TaxID=2899136 RepID=UPI001EE7851A|nr:superinfection immunity protein [Halorhodospira sp. 9622]MCG5538958.1 superinfection immunity protein [Halorhodospira sp. 9622]